MRMNPDHDAYLVDQNEKLYTLAEAKLELHRKECDRVGHSFNIEVVGSTPDPRSLACLRCGRVWTVTEKPYFTVEEKP